MNVNLHQLIISQDIPLNPLISKKGSVIIQYTVLNKNSFISAIDPFSLLLFFLYCVYISIDRAIVRNSADPERSS